MRFLKTVIAAVAALAAVAAVLFIATRLNPTKAAAVTRPPARVIPDSIEERYLELLKCHLTRYDYGDPDSNEGDAPPTRIEWPKTAETMIGLSRMDNLHACIKTVIHENIPGDLLEAGAWRGGACIFMRAALKAYGEASRNVWVADSFEGMPRPESAVDTRGFAFWKHNDALAVSMEEVQGNFRRYGLLDERVRFLKGWFKDTLPVAPVERLAILRADGDLYDSTMQTLEPLYDKVSQGGYVIVDDYFSIEGARRATDDFRRRRGISDPIQRIDWTGAYWRKSH